jgi:trk system potassium uptake protein TrkH
MPYWMTGELDLSSSFFEGMSAVTTNGVTALESIQALPVSVLFWRGITHWLGGLGIIVVFISLLPRMAGGAVHLFVAEATGFNEDRLLPRLRSTARILFFIYSALTVAEAILLFICGMDLFDAVNHAMATVATAGFSTYDNGIMHYNSPLIEFVIFIFMVLAGANFALYYKVYYKDGGSCGKMKNSGISCILYLPHPALLHWRFIWVLSRASGNRSGTVSLWWRPFPQLQVLFLQITSSGLPLPNLPWYFCTLPEAAPVPRLAVSRLPGL